MDSTTDKQSRRGWGRTNKAEWGYIITLSMSIFFSRLFILFSTCLVASNPSDLLNFKNKYLLK